MPSLPQFIEQFAKTDVLLQIGPKEDDTDRDVTGWSLRFRLMDSTGAVVIEKTTADDVNIIDEGNYEVDLTDGSSYDLPIGSYNYVIRVLNQPTRGVDVFGEWIVRASLDEA